MYGVTVGFQSSPLIAEGRYKYRGIGGIDRRSFNPRPSSLRGATRGSSPGHQASWRFNPRPSSLRGATARRTLPAQPCRCFNPRPSSLRGATVRSFLYTQCRTRFQSSPLIAEGRYWRLPPHPDLFHRFNPRPSSLRGATSA